MEKSPVAATIVLIALTLAFLATPTYGATWSHSSSSAPAAPVAGHAPLHAAAIPAVPTPFTGYPRTVLVETFTGVWCIHCPAESQALHYISEDMNRSVVDIAELHVCAFPPGSGPCLENYVPPDGTSDARGAFYSVCGFPDVFFDGIDSRPPLTSNCGATNSASQMQTQYEQYIANASKFPGNVSISETASVSGSNVTGHVDVTSALNGSYNLVTYLIEKIDKLNQTNGYGPHDVDTVVRETLYNHPVALTWGDTTGVNFRGSIDPTWNTLNLSLVSLVQQNSTHIVENANTVPVSTLTTAVATTQSSLYTGANATVTVQVANSSTGAPVSGASIVMVSSAGGTFTPASGFTDAYGAFSAVFQAPPVTSTTTIAVTAQVTANGYTAGSGSVLFSVDPLVAPQVPTAAFVAPGEQQVLLNWSAPISGQGGVTYHVYRASSPTGTFTEVSVGPTLGYLDTDLTVGQSYWYRVSAQNSAGFSPNTTAISATAVSVVPVDLPSYVGWWFSIDATNFSAGTSSPMYLYLPNGFVGFSYGPTSYAYLPGDTPSPLTISGDPLTVNVSFVPRYAILQGSVTPVTATVTVNGTAVDVVGGSFTQYLAAGIYIVNVTAPGFQANQTTVTLTPGNTTPFSTSLHAVPGGSGTSTNSMGGLTNDELLIVVAGVIILVGALAGAMYLSRGRKRGGSPPRKAP